MAALTKQAQILYAANAPQQLATQVPELRRQLDDLTAERSRLSDAAAREQASYNQWISENPTWGNPAAQAEEAHRKQRLKTAQQRIDCTLDPQYVNALELALRKHQAKIAAATEQAANVAAWWEVVGSAPANSSLEARAIPPFPSTSVDDTDHPTVLVYLRAHRDRFVFARVEHDAFALDRPIVRGEALLVTAVDDGKAWVVPLGSHFADRSVMALTDISPISIAGIDPVAIKADWLDVVGPNGAHGGYADLTTVYDQGAALYGPPKFLLFAPTDPAVQSFLATRDRTNRCYDRVMAKLDPDGQRENFDIVHYEGGTIRRVESLNSKLDRQACGQCDCKGLNVLQRRLARQILAPLQAKRLGDEYGELIARMRTLWSRR